MSYWNNFNKKFRMTYESSKKILCCKLYVGTFFYVSEVICKTKRKDAKKYANFRNRNLTVRKLCLFMFSHISSFIYTPLKKIWQRLILFILKSHYMIWSIEGERNEPRTSWWIEVNFGKRVQEELEANSTAEWPDRGDVWWYSSTTKSKIK